MTVIIAISGKIESGKDTVANAIDREYRFKTHTYRTAFAYPLKELCVNVLGLTVKQCYSDKNDFVKHLGMSAREVMQIFGTECVRRWFGNVWADAAVRRIRSCGADLATISDCRFRDEVETILKQPQGYVIRLTRSPNIDAHSSESDLDGFNWGHERCFVVDNAKMTLEEQDVAVLSIVDKIWKDTYPLGLL